MDLLVLTQFFMYMTGVNILIYLLSLVLFVYFKKSCIKFNLKILKLSDKHKGDLESLVLRSMSAYKLLIIMFNLVPLIALKLMI